MPLRALHWQVMRSDLELGCNADTLALVVAIERVLCHLTGVKCETGLGAARLRPRRRMRLADAGPRTKVGPRLSAERAPRAEPGHLMLPVGHGDCPCGVLARAISTCSASAAQSPLTCAPAPQPSLRAASGTCSSPYQRTPRCSRRARRARGRPSPAPLSRAGSAGSAGCATWRRRLHSRPAATTRAACCACTSSGRCRCGWRSAPPTGAWGPASAARPAATSLLHGGLCKQCAPCMCKLPGPATAAHCSHRLRPVRALRPSLATCKGVPSEAAMATTAY